MRGSAGEGGGRAAGAVRGVSGRGGGLFSSAVLGIPGRAARRDFTGSEGRLCLRETWREGRGTVRTAAARREPLVASARGKFKGLGRGAAAAEQRGGPGAARPCGGRGSPGAVAGHCSPSALRRGPSAFQGQGKHRDPDLHESCWQRLSALSQRVPAGTPASLFPSRCPGAGGECLGA